MPLWLGDGFQRAYICILLLILPSIFELPQHIAGLTVIAEGKVKLQSGVYTLMAVINIILSILLTREFQEVGAAVSVCCAYLFRTAAMNVIYHRKLKINVFRFFRECFVKMGGCLLLSLLAAIIISMLPGGSLLLFLVKGISIVLIYLILFWSFGLNEYEKELFLSMFHKIRVLLKN